MPHQGKPPLIHSLLFRLRMFKYNCKLLHSGPERMLYITVLIAGILLFLFFVFHMGARP